MWAIRRMSGELKKNKPNLLQPPLVMKSRSCPLHRRRSTPPALCKNQAARVGCCVFFVFLSLVFIWSVGKKDLSIKIQHRNHIDDRLNVGINLVCRCCPVCRCAGVPNFFYFFLLHRCFVLYIDVLYGTHGRRRRRRRRHRQSNLL